MKKIHLLTTLLLPIMAWSELNEYQTDIYFANGILTEDKDAKYNAEEVLAPAIENNLYQNEDEMKKYIGKVDYAYNSTHGMGLDVWESITQKLGVDGGIDMLWDTAHNADLSLQIEKYQASIHQGHKVLVVAHSQGNLFTYDALYALENDSTTNWMINYFEVVSIASPQMIQIKENTPLVSWDNDLVAQLGVYNSAFVVSPIRNVYWEAVIGDNTSTISLKPNANYVEDYQVNTIYNFDWKALEAGVNVAVHSFRFYMGEPLEDENATVILNPFDNSVLQTNDAKIAIINDIQAQLQKLDNVESQWIYDTNSSDLKVFLKHKFDDEIRILNLVGDASDVYPFNVSQGKVYQLPDDGAKYVKALYGGTKIESEWEGQALNEVYRLDNPEEEKVLTDRFKFNSEENLTIIDTKNYLLWDNSIYFDNWNDANGYCEGLVSDSYDAWRMPTFSELKSILNPATSNHIYEEFFTALATKPYGYWSSNTFTSYEMAWSDWLGWYLVEGKDSLVLNYKNASYISIDTKYNMNFMCVQQL